MMNNLDKIFDESNSTADFSDKYLNYLTKVIADMPRKEIGELIDKLLECREQGKMIFFVGNGGSAATSSHFANDISIGTRTKTKPFKALSLTDNVAILTALGNDDGYDSIFIRQLQNYAKPGDVLVAISASGNSPNIVEVMKWAKDNKMFTVGLSGFDGGKLREMSDLKVHIPTPKGEYGPVEDAHMIVDHLVGSYLIRKVKQTE